MGELQRRLHLIVHDAVDHQLVDLSDPTVADAVSVYGGFQQDAVLDRRIGAAQTRFGKPRVGGFFLLFAAGFAPLLLLAVGYLRPYTVEADEYSRKDHEAADDLVADHVAVNVDL